MNKLCLVTVLAMVLAPTILSAQEARPRGESGAAKADDLAPPPTTSAYFQGRLLYRIGEDPELRPPQVVSAPDPPPLSDFSAGTVTLWCVVDNEGKIHMVKVAKRLSKEADMKALANLQQWKFKPAKLKKDDVDMLITVDVVWH
jgi:TonB family protein